MCSYDAKSVTDETTGDASAMAFRHPMIFVLAAVLIYQASATLVLPLLPTLIGQVTGSGVADAARWGGLLLVAYALPQFLLAPLIGALSDRFGRRPVLLLSLVGLAADYAVLAVAPGIGWLIAARLIGGITGACLATALACAADLTPPAERMIVFGRLHAMAGLGLMIGPLVAGLLARIDPRLAFWVGAAVALLAAGYGAAILRETLPRTRRRAFDWRRANPVGALWSLAAVPGCARLLAALALIFLAIQSVIGTLPYLAVAKYGWDETRIGSALALVGALAVVIQAMLVPRLKAGLGDRGCIVASLVLYAASLGLLAIAPSGAALYLALVPYALACFGFPALHSRLSRQLPAERQGELQGGVAALISGAALVGPVIMTTLFAACSGPAAVVSFPGAPMLLGAVLAVLALVVVGPALRQAPAAS
ncbi:MAG: MFS transporter [Azospirillum sp.]|nr:MFS transporter [Azospirillum sp.]